MWNKIYQGILREVYVNGSKEFNERTKTMTIRKFGVSFVIRDVNYLPLLTIRKMFPKTGAAELAWSLLGTRDTEWLNKYTSIWKKFEDSPGIISGAYGHRWRHAFGRDQIFDLIALLKKDPSNRQGVVVTWDASSDGLMNTGKSKNVPCPYTFVCNVINNKLNIMVAQRSADMILGLPYDVMMYSLLNMAIAKELGVVPGDVMFSIADAHVYEPYFGVTEELLRNSHEEFCSCFDSMSVSEIISSPDDYVNCVVDYAMTYSCVDYSPRLECIQ